MGPFKGLRPFGAFFGVSLVMGMLHQK